MLFYGVSGQETKTDTVSGRAVLPITTFLGLYDTTWQTVFQKQ